MIEILVDGSRLLLLGASLAGVIVLASERRFAAIFHAATFLGLLGFLVFGFQSSGTPAFVLLANIGTTGVIGSVLAQEFKKERLK